MKTIDGKNFLTIGEVAEIIGRTTITIRNWYGWAIANDKTDLLPTIYYLDDKGTRFFWEGELYKFKKFKENIKYGKLADYNRKLWGKRYNPEK